MKTEFVGGDSEDTNAYEAVKYRNYVASSFTKKLTPFSVVQQLLTARAALLYGHNYIDRDEGLVAR